MFSLDLHIVSYFRGKSEGYESSARMIFFSFRLSMTRLAKTHFVSDVMDMMLGHEEYYLNIYNVITFISKA